jgi:acyl-CoA thioesterase-1
MSARGKTIPLFPCGHVTNFHALLPRRGLLAQRHLRTLKGMSPMPRIVHWLPVSAFSLVCALAGAARAEPRKPTHVACVGDSITAGAGASDPSKNYVSLLQGLLGNTVQVKNFGHSGATMLSAGHGDLPYNQQPEYTAATDFVTGAGAQAVVSVVIILGANDSKPFNWDPASGKNDQQYKADYLVLVDHFLGLTPKPVVYVAYPLATGNNPCCSIRGNVIHDEELPLIKQVAMEKHLPIIDLNTPTTGHPEYFGDGVHPNDAGYVVMAGLVKKGLEREPTVSITSPTMGAMVALGPLMLTADASADAVDIASVEFFQGATSLGKATTKPFAINLSSVEVGQHSITAKAIDATLANKTSDPITFTVMPGDVLGGSGGSGGIGGNAGAATGGTATGGATMGGVATGGAVTAGGSTASMAGSASGGAPSAAGSGNGTAGAAPADDAGCSCAVPGSKSRGAGLAFALLGSLLGWCAVRRRAA